MMIIVRGAVSAATAKAKAARLRGGSSIYARWRTFTRARGAENRMDDDDTC